MALNHQKDQNGLEREHPVKDQASHQQGIMNAPFLINERQRACLGSQPLHKVIRLPKDLRKTLIGFFCKTMVNEQLNPLELGACLVPVFESTKMMFYGNCSF